MNLFRSEEHVRNWINFKAGTEEGMNKVSDVARLFSGRFFTRRLDPDYFSRMQEYLMEVIEILKGMGSFWKPAEK